MGHKSVSTVVSAPVQGVRWGAICEHGRLRSKCKECGGHQSASTVVSALVQGVRWVTNLRARSSALSCKECGGHQSASTVVSALRARSAVGRAICEHGRRRSTVQGVRWVINLRARSYSAISARSAVGDQSASTVVGALHARSAVGHQSASTVVSALSARSAVGHKSASTVVAL